MSLPEATYRIASGVLQQRVGADLMLMDSRIGEYFEVNASGQMLFEAWGKGLGVEAAAVALTQRFDINLEQARADCLELQRALLQARLIEPVSP